MKLTDYDHDIDSHDIPPEGIHTLHEPPKLPPEPPPYNHAHSSIQPDGECKELFRLVFQFQAVWCLIFGSNNHSNILRTDDNNYYALKNNNNYYSNNIRLVFRINGNNYYARNQI